MATRGWGNHEITIAGVIQTVIIYIIVGVQRTFCNSREILAIAECAVAKIGEFVGI